MKRNPFFIVILVLVVCGALYFRFASPSQSLKLKEMAQQLQEKTSDLVAPSSSSTNEVDISQEAQLKAEEAQIVAEQNAQIVPATLLDPKLIGKGGPARPVAAAPAAGSAESAEGEAEAAMKRANDLLAQAMKAADEAKAQIRIAQKQLDSEMRARPNLSLLPKSSSKAAAAAPVEKQKPATEEKEAPAPKTVVNSGAPLSQIEKVFAESVIRFDWTRSILNDDAQIKIDDVVKALKLNPEISVRVIGHTDANGTEELNNWLGLIRARRVRQQLIAKGINPKRISVSSQGAKDPIDSNDTPMGRWKNRRVEFAVSEK